MNSSFKIDKPCPKPWDSMEEDLEGKFCQFCEKPVLDLTKKNDVEISEIVKIPPKSLWQIINFKI